MREKCSKRFFDNFHRFGHFGHFGQKLVKIAIWLDVWMCLFKGWKSLKNLKVGVFETDFKQVPFVFRQTGLITQKRFWPFFGVLSGFLGFPGTISFGSLSLDFDNFFGRKTVGSRETPRDGLLELKSIEIIPTYCQFFNCLE